MGRQRLDAVTHHVGVSTNAEPVAATLGRMRPETSTAELRADLRNRAVRL
jgi:hypothetical protein